jgi:DNA invertase Pin-like site-specific DNA recombinase
MKGRFVAYYRVSTEGQGRSGLGLESQRAAVLAFLNGGSWKLVAERTEVESGKRDDNRPALAEAMQLCRVHDATLLIAKLDRLSRDAHFLLGLQKAGVRFVAADMPHADNFTVGVMALLAQKEREMISERTKAALAAAKARGVKLGGKRPGVVMTAEIRASGQAARIERADAFARDLAPTIETLRAKGVTSLRGLARALNEANIPPPRKQGVWSDAQVKALLERINKVS